jgi:hypothetical protein
MTLVIAIDWLTIIIPLPLYICVRFSVRNDRKRLYGCVISFIIWWTNFILCLIFSQFPLIILMPDGLLLGIVITGLLLFDLLKQFKS